VGGECLTPPDAASGRTPPRHKLDRIDASTAVHGEGGIRTLDGGL